MAPRPRVVMTGPCTVPIRYLHRLAVDLHSGMHEVGAALHPRILEVVDDVDHRLRSKPAFASVWQADVTSLSELTAVFALLDSEPALDKRYPIAG